MLIDAALHRDKWGEVLVAAAAVNNAGLALADFQEFPTEREARPKRWRSWRSDPAVPLAKLSKTSYANASVPQTGHSTEAQPRRADGDHVPAFGYRRRPACAHHLCPPIDVQKVHTVVSRKACSPLLQRLIIDVASMPIECRWGKGG